MNDLGAPNWNNVIQLDRQERPPVERETKNLPRRAGRPRWGGRLFGLGVFLSGRNDPALPTVSKTRGRDGLSHPN